MTLAQKVIACEYQDVTQLDDQPVDHSVDQVIGLVHRLVYLLALRFGQVNKCIQLASRFAEGVGNGGKASWLYDHSLLSGTLSFIYLRRTRI